MKHEGLSGETCLFVEVTAGVTGRRRSRWRPGRGRSAEAGACAVRLACRSQSFALSNARSWVHPGSNPTTVCHCYKFCLEGDQAINISICFKKSIREILWKTLTKPGAWVSHRGMRKLIGRRDTEPRRSQMIKKKKRSILLRGEMNVTCECYRNPEVGEGVWGEAVRVLFDLSVNLGQDSSQRWGWGPALWREGAACGRAKKAEVLSSWCAAAAADMNMSTLMCFWKDYRADAVELVFLFNSSHKSGDAMLERKGDSQNKGASTFLADRGSGC